MCFSANASFTLSAALGGLGAIALQQNRLREHRMFAAIPLLFAVQQSAEGMVWVTMSDPGQTFVHRIAISVFLAMALVVWPLWMPLALRRAETEPDRRKMLTPLAGIGLLVAGFAVVQLLREPPVARIVGHSLSYGYGPTVARDFAYLAIYVVPAALPFFVSSLRRARVAGVVLVSSLILADLVQRDAITSVWCFFAAVFSGLIVLIVVQQPRVAAPVLARIVDARQV